MDKIKKIRIKKIKIINNKKGKIIKIFNQFILENKYEIYSSEIKYKSIKAWKYHKEITNNFYVILGKVKFVILIKKKIFTIDLYNNKTLTLPPGYWYGFQGLEKSKNVILNLIDAKHSKKEMVKKKINQIKYSW